MYQLHVPTTCTNIRTNYMYQLYVPTVCTNYMYQLYVPTICTNYMYQLYMYQLYVPTICTNYMYQLYVPTICTNYMYQLYAPTSSHQSTIPRVIHAIYFDTTKTAESIVACVFIPLISPQSGHPLMMWISMLCYEGLIYLSRGVDVWFLSGVPHDLS